MTLAPPTTYLSSFRTAVYGFALWLCTHQCPREVCMQPLALLLLFQGHAASQKAPTVAKKAMGTRAPSPAPAHLGRVAALGGPSRSPYDGRALNVADDDRSRSSIAPTHGGGHCLPPRRRRWSHCCRCTWYRRNRTTIDQKYGNQAHRGLLRDCNKNYMNMNK